MFVLSQWLQIYLTEKQQFSLERKNQAASGVYNLTKTLSLVSPLLLFCFSAVMIKCLLFQYIVLSFGIVCALCGNSGAELEFSQ